jgi:DNA-directed RNA polymerase specialized sigma24 family protein
VGGKSQENQWALLLSSANAGDAEAYRQLLLQLTPVLRAFGRRGLARAGLSDMDAEDIVQETLLAIHLKRQSWDEDAPRACLSLTSIVTSKACRPGNAMSYAPLPSTVHQSARLPRGFR